MFRRSFMLGAAAAAASAAPAIAQMPGSGPPSTGGPEVRLRPDADFNALVAKAPARTRIILAPGTYRGWSAEPKDGQRFEAEAEGAVLDGGGERLFAFKGRAQDVQLVGLTVQGYETMVRPDVEKHPRQLAAIEAPEGRNWQLIDLTVQRIGGRGVSMNPGMHILRGRYVDNGHVGIAGRGPHVTIERAEIANNNTRRYGSHWESGGHKNAGGSDRGELEIMTGARLIECHVHHNYGRAVWFDWDCTGCGLERCVIHHNSHDGIAYEASARGTFRDCLIGFNNTTAPGESIAWDADLMLQNAKECVVEGCTIVAAQGCALAIAHHTRDRHGDPPQQRGFYTGVFDGMRNRITNNTFILLDDAVGLVMDVTAPEPDQDEVTESNVWGPNRWLAPPGSGDRRLWLGRTWRERLGTLEEHVDLTPFIPPELKG